MGCNYLSLPFLHAPGTTRPYVFARDREHGEVDNLLVSLLMDDSHFHNNNTIWYIWWNAEAVSDDFVPRYREDSGYFRAIQQIQFFNCQERNTWLLAKKEETIKCKNFVSYTLRREYRVVRYRYSRLLFTSEDRLCANLHVQEQSTNMTSQCQCLTFAWRHISTVVTSQY